MTRFHLVGLSDPKSPRAGEAAVGAVDLKVRSRNDQPHRSIALFGLFGSGNFGNDASLQAMIETLRVGLPDAELVCICHNGEAVERDFGIATLPIRHWRSPGFIAQMLNQLFLRVPGKLVDAANSIRTIRRFEALIVPGTGMLDDFGDRPVGMPLYIFMWCLAARLSGVKVAFVCVGAGPIGHPVSRWLMLAAARLAHFRSYRDHTSKEFMSGLGLETGADPVLPDIVFKLPVPAHTRARKRKGGRPVVGIGVMNYRGWYGFAADGEQIYAQYIEKLAAFLLYLLESGYGIRLLTGDLDDEDAIERVLRRIQELRPEISDERLLVDRCRSLHDVTDNIAATDFVVATRYHNIVSALRLGRPTISLGYAKKNDVLMAQVGLGAFCQHVERFEVPALIEQFGKLVAQRTEYERVIRQHTKLFAETLEQGLKAILDGPLKDRVPRPPKG